MQRAVCLLLSVLAAPALGGEAARARVDRAMSPAALVAATRSSRTRQGAADPAFDCAWREYAAAYAAGIQPGMSAAQRSALCGTAARMPPVPVRFPCSGVRPLRRSACAC